MSSPSGEVLILPAFGQGHLFPCIELCNHITSHNLKATLLIFSTLSSSLPTSFPTHPLVHVIHIPAPPGPTPIPMNPLTQTQLHFSLQTHLSNRDQTLPIFAIADVLIIVSWSHRIFSKFNVPTIGFFTSGACSAAMEYATWKANIKDDINPGEVQILPGLPEEMGLSCFDLKRRPGKQMGFPGDKPPWVNDTENCVGLMINTCDDLEGCFIDYLRNELKKPVWGVGPLFPEQYWKSAGCLVHDSEIRSNREVNVSEESVIQWLDSKPRGSVLYVSFGSSVDLSKEEYPQLASALEASTHPFIWVIRKDAGRIGPPGGTGGEEGYCPDGLEERVGERGMIIRGWAPQLLILSHKSTGGFLSHCGWNSTMEAIGRGVPFLAWPLRGDQYYDAKLVISHLKIGYDVCEDLSKMVIKDDIVEGIDKLMGDKEMKTRAEALAAKFQLGFPNTSVDALDAFTDLVKGNV